MGNWNRRWRPRRKYYNYQEHPPSTLSHYSSESYSQVGKSSVPSWEINFVSSMGVPWKKVVVAKRYMFCHDNIIQWDDSAAEKAFYDSKKRYWATINELICDIPLPDPDIYIDEIDWNAHIDPELILDLDREYFNPDDTEEVEKVKIVNQHMHDLPPGQSLGWDVMNCDSPWEASALDGNKGSKDIVEGWSTWENSMDSKNADNPWERSYGQVGDMSRDIVWGGQTDKLCSLQQGQNHSTQSHNFCKTFDNSWDSACQNGGSFKSKGFETDGTNFKNLKDLDMKVNGSKAWNEGSNSWGNHFDEGTRTLKYRGWKDCGENSWGWDHRDIQSNESKHLDFRRTNGYGRGFNTGCRKREGPQQQTWRNKSSRFQEENYETGHQWKMRHNQKRASFV